MRCALAFIFSVYSIMAMAQDQGTGLLFDDVGYMAVPKKARLVRGDYSFLPESSSLKSYAPLPGNQLVLNTSPAWATAYSAKTILNAINNRLTDKQKISESSFAPSFTFYMIKDKSDKECSSGAYLHEALESLKTDGAVPYMEFQYFCPESVSPDLIAAAKSSRITDYSRVFDDSDSEDFKIKAVKKAIYNKFPVVIGMYTPPSFRTTKEFWQPREKFSKDFEKQALCVVGYDDTKYGGSFEVLNSWGRNWGNDGYMWIPYKIFNEFVKYAYEVYEEKNLLTSQDMGGEVVINLEDGGKMNAQLASDQGFYKVLQPYPTGTGIQIVIENQQTAYAYVIGTDLTYQWWQLFPLPESYVSPLLTYPSNHVALPDEDTFITLEDPPGKDYLCVIYSKEELDIEGIVQRLTSSSGDVMTRLKQVLGTKIVDYSNLDFGQSQVTFKGFSKGKSIVPVVIEIDHI